MEELLVVVSHLSQEHTQREIETDTQTHTRHKKAEEVRLERESQITD